MTTDSSIPTYPRGQEGQDDLQEEDDLVRPLRFGGVSTVPALSRIIDLAMVSLLGGGPRLALRATRAFLEDSYEARSAARQGRLRRRVRQRG
jgi:hypothetical protein